MISYKILTIVSLFLGRSFAGEGSAACSIWIDEHRQELSSEYQSNINFIDSIKVRVDTYLWVQDLIKKELYSQIENTPDQAKKDFYETYVKKHPKVTAFEKSMFAPVLDNARDAVAKKITWQDCGQSWEIQRYRDHAYIFPIRCKVHFSWSERATKRSRDYGEMSEKLDDTYYGASDILMGLGVHGNSPYANLEWWTDGDGYRSRLVYDATFLTINKDQFMSRNKNDNSVLFMDLSTTRILKAPTKQSLLKKLGIQPMPSFKKFAENKCKELESSTR